MTKYLVSYDLDEPGPQDYDRVIRKIKSLGGKEVLRSQWALRSDLSASGLRDALTPFIDTDTDRLLVCPLANWSAWDPMADINSI